MPDLIFTVLFFFMIVTHMRSDEVKVRLQVPAGVEVQKLANKQAVVNIYIGRQ
jgi:biopolymer transport protein ExbD